MSSVKSGWLQKLSGFFKNTWKKRYFVLYQSGDFCYYQDPHDKELDGKINMKTECRKINVGYQVGEGVKAPKDMDALFSVVSTERTFFLVADSATEAREWVAALEQARVPVAYGGPPPTTGPYPQQAPYGQPPVGPPPAYTPQAPPGAYPMPNPASAYPPPGHAYPPQPQYPRPPPQPYPQQPAPYPQQGYPPQPYPQQPPPGAYAPPPPGAYPQQQYRPPGPQYVQQPPPQTVYVQNPNQEHKSSSRNKMMMGAGAGALGGAAMGYMLGRSTGGFGHHGYGGWDSDHSWSSGSFDCDFD